jgi:ribosome-associated translation inhibitor RaiA
MIDEEVETVLREIRERVLSQPLAQPSLPEPPPGGANGNQHSQALAAGETTAPRSAAMARLNAHLTTTARAWDRLPPVFSNRRGTAARIEVWIKARLKRFSRWFTWEQVNFNAAVHHALLETLQALNEQEAAIVALRAKLAQLQAEAKTEGEALRVEIPMQFRAEIEALRDEIQKQLSNEIDNQYAEINSLRGQLQADAASGRIEVQNQQRETNALRAELRGELESVRIRTEDQGTELQAGIETARNEAETNLAKLSNELREREERLENEQRVCFKQLLLETNEIAGSSDRAQQRISTLIEETNQRLKQLEDSRKQEPRS